MNYITQMAILSGLLLAGCSTLTPTHNSISVDGTPSHTLATLDEKLAKIDDAESADEAVTYFVDHVRDRLSNGTKTGIQSQSTALSDRIKRLAQFESSARGVDGAIRLQSTDLISAETVADVMSDVVNTNGKSTDFTAEQVKQTQHVVRDNLPHLAIGKSTQMTPLEASVIAYYMLTGDTGNKAKPDTTISATDDDLVEFVDRIQNQEATR